MSRHSRPGKDISPTLSTMSIWPTSSTIVNILNVSNIFNNGEQPRTKGWHTFRMPSSKSFERPCAAAVFRSTAFRVVHRRCCLCCMSRTATTCQTARILRLEGREARENADNTDDADNAPTVVIRGACYDTGTCSTFWPTVHHSD